MNLRSLAQSLIRLVLGGLFIFSGVIKMNDPLGFSYKLEEYFGADVFNLEFLQPLALPMAVFLVTLEVVLGLLMLIGYLRAFTFWSMAGLMVFFTFLTFYSAYFNKVTDCGCFGDAIPLTPWESFTKDVILSVLIALYFALGLRNVKPIMSRFWARGVMGLAVFAMAFFTNWVYNHLPVWDFRAYKAGTDIAKAMAPAEELGLTPPQYDVVYTLRKGEEVMEVTGTDYVDQKWWEKPEWVMDAEATRNIKVADGYEPPVHDFAIAPGGEDQTAQWLDYPESYWLVAYDFGRADMAQLERMCHEFQKLHDAGIPVVGLTSTDLSEVAALQARTGTSFPWSNGDGTALKTIVRSNPGATHLRKGVVVKHYHFNDFPAAE